MNYNKELVWLLWSYMYCKYLLVLTIWLALERQLSLPHFSVNFQKLCEAQIVFTILSRGFYVARMITIGSKGASLLVCLQIFILGILMSINSSSLLIPISCCSYAWFATDSHWSEARQYPPCFVELHFRYKVMHHIVRLIGIAFQ